MSTSGERYEEFRKQNKAFLLGKLYTALFCQWPPMGPPGAIAGEACGVAGGMGPVLGLNPGYLGK